MKQAYSIVTANFHKISAERENLHIVYYEKCNTAELGGVWQWTKTTPIRIHGQTQLQFSNTTFHFENKNLLFSNITMEHGQTPT